MAEDEFYTLNLQWFLCCFSKRGPISVLHCFFLNIRRREIISYMGLAPCVTQNLEYKSRIKEDLSTECGALTHLSLDWLLAPYDSGSIRLCKNKSKIKSAVHFKCRTSIESFFMSGAFADQQPANGQCDVIMPSCLG